MAVRKVPRWVTDWLELNEGAVAELYEDIGYVVILHGSEDWVSVAAYRVVAYDSESGEARTVGQMRKTGSIIQSSAIMLDVQDGGRVHFGSKATFRDRDEIVNWQLLELRVYDKAMELLEARKREGLESASGSVAQH